MEKLNLTAFFAIILFFCYHLDCKGQVVDSDKLKLFVPDSAIQSEIRVFEGDLNRDNFEDIILRFKMKNDPEYQEHVYLLLGQGNGKYELAAKNDSLELDDVDGTAFDKIVIKNGYFSLEYTGYGNTSGSYEIITFRYSDIDKNWLLHRQGSRLIHRYSEAEPIESMSTQKDFGKILFENYRY